MIKKHKVIDKSFLSFSLYGIICVIPKFILKHAIYSILDLKFTDCFNELCAANTNSKQCLDSLYQPSAVQCPRITCPHHAVTAAPWWRLVHCV